MHESRLTDEIDAVALRIAHDVLIADPKRVPSLAGGALCSHMKTVAVAGAYLANEYRRLLDLPEKQRLEAIQQVLNR